MGTGGMERGGIGRHAQVFSCTSWRFHTVEFNQSAPLPGQEFRYNCRVLHFSPIHPKCESPAKCCPARRMRSKYNNAISDELQCVLGDGLQSKEMKMLKVNCRILGWSSHYKCDRLS